MRLCSQHSVASASGGIVGLIAAYFLLNGIFDGVSKGTGLIIILLFMILLALMQRR